MTIPLTETKNGLVLAVRVLPRSSRTEAAGVRDGALKISRRAKLRTSLCVSWNPSWVMAATSDSTRRPPPKNALFAARTSLAAITGSV